MCTVTFLPKTKKSYLLTHNRDEHHTRSIALLPEKKFIHGQAILLPTDSKAGGTWFAASNDFTLCILNGGFEKHVSSPPYRHSRGNVIIDFFKFNDIILFSKEYSIDNIEPFTLIIVDNNTQQLFQLINDGTQFHIEEKDCLIPHIWSSTTLYSNEKRTIRKNIFEKFIAQNNFSQNAIIDFHTNKFENYEDEGIQINRNEILKTVSLTSLHKEEKISLKYFDFIEHKSSEIEL